MQVNDAAARQLFAGTREVRVAVLRAGGGAKGVPRLSEDSPAKALLAAKREKAPAPQQAAKRVQQEEDPIDLCDDEVCGDTARAPEWCRCGAAARRDCLTHAPPPPPPVQDQDAGLRERKLVLVAALRELCKALRERLGLSRSPLTTSVQALVRTRVPAEGACRAVVSLACLMHPHQIAKHAPRSAEEFRALAITGLSDRMKERYESYVVATIRQGLDFVGKMHAGAAQLADFVLDTSTMFQVSQRGGGGGGGAKHGLAAPPGAVLVRD